MVLTILGPGRGGRGADSSNRRMGPEAKQMGWVFEAQQACSLLHGAMGSWALDGVHLRAHQQAESCWQPQGGTQRHGKQNRQTHAAGLLFHFTVVL